jgi:PAS domain S-box-containing protein
LILPRDRPEDAHARLDELEEIYRSAPVGLCLVDPELRFRRTNERFAAMNGRSVAEHVGRKVEEVLPELADQILPRYRKVLLTGDRIENVTMSDPRSGRTWLVSDHPVRSGAGPITGIITVVQDVTDRARIQREMRIVRERLRLAEQVAHLGCWEWDLPNDELWWSLETYRIFGRDPRTFDPTFDEFIEHVISEDRPRVRELLDTVWAEGGEATAEIRILAADGSERMLRGIAMLRRDEGGEPLFLFGTVQDISGECEERERWAAERAALVREREELEALLRERTGALDRALDRLRRRRR